MAKKKKVRKGRLSKAKCGVQDQGCSGMVYVLGFIGSAVYYISHATCFWNGVWGFIKALIWPAFLVYELLKFLGQ